MYKTVLVPLDGSELAEAVLPYSENLARRLNAEILLVRGISLTFLNSGAPEFSASPEVYQQLLDAETYAASDYLNTVAARLQAQGIRVRTEVTFAPAATAILDAVASNTDTTLITMTTHGRTGIARLALGSVANTVVREAETPVLLIRSAGEQPQKIDTILVPLDGSQVAEAVLPSVETLAIALETRVVLLRAVVPGEEDEAHHYLQAVSRRLEAAGVSDALTCVRPGHPEVAIHNMAVEEPNVLIAMATHGRSGLKRWVLGSIAEQVVHNATVPTLLVRGHEPAHKGHAQSAIQATTAP